MDLVREVRQQLRERRLINAGETVVCAVSGGADSMALLHVLAQLAGELDLRLIAAHMNHGFRVEESEQEAETVRRFAEQLGVPFEYRRVDVPAYARESGLNAQAAAREARYQFLHECAKLHAASAIALAHHLDDQAETVLLNLLSGGAMTGLSGMSWSKAWNNVKRVRPFLRISKKAILAYAEEHCIPYCTDSSNATTKYERNRLRLEIMPQLLTFNPNLPLTLARTAEVLRDEDAYMEERAVDCFKRIVTVESGVYTASRRLFCDEPLALQRRLIKLILNYLAADPRFSDYTKVELIRKAIIAASPPSLSLDAGASIRFERAYDRLTWRIIHAAEQSNKVLTAYEYVWQPGDRELVLSEAGGVLRMTEGEAESAEPSLPGEAVFDADLLEFPITVRPRRDGDRFEPLGLNGSKKVKDMFIDLKIDPNERERMPILVDAQGRLLWIPGIRRSRHALVSAGTKRVVRFRFEAFSR